MRKKNLTIAISLCAILSSTAVIAQKYADQLIRSGPCNNVTLLCPSGVENDSYAVDLIGDNFARMQTEIGVAATSYLRVGFSTPVTGGSYIAVIVQDGPGLISADALAALSIRLYNDAGTQVKSKIGFQLADLKVFASAGNLKMLRIHSKLGDDVKEVKLNLGGLVSVLNELRVVGVYSFANCEVVDATSIHAEGPCNPIIPIVCPGGIINSANAVSVSETDYAVMAIPLGIAGNAYLDLAFSELGKGGERVGFEIKSNNTLLNVNLLAKINVKVYDNLGNVVKDKSGFALADLEVSPLYPDRYRIHVRTPAGTYQIARIRVTLTSLVSALTDLRVYRAYHIPATYKLDVNTDGPLSFCVGDNVKFTCPGGATGLYTYQWYKNNEVITGATANKYKATTEGAYHIVRTFDGCQSLSPMYNVYTPCKLSLDQVNDISVYPNPSNNTFTIDLPQPFDNDSKVTLSDITGKTIETFQWNAEQKLIIGNQLVAGAYIITLTDNNAFKHIKVMKSN